MNPKLDAIDRSKPQKLYCQLLDVLKQHIEEGNWRVGTQIPTEEQLCSQYNVSKATVRLAVSELVSLGYLKRFQGKGTFVRRKKPTQSIMMLANLGEEGTYHDFSFLARVIENRTVQPDEAVQNSLNLSEEDPCFFISRLIIAEGTPFLVQKLYVPYVLAPRFLNAEDGTEISFYGFVENQCGIRIQRVKERMDIVQIGKEDAELLDLAPDLSVLRARLVCYAHGETPISFCESLYRTGKYTKTMEFERLKM